MSAEAIVDSGVAQTHMLNDTVPTFARLIYGYARPNAEEITTQNSGNSTVNISNAALTSGDFMAFEISGGGTTFIACSNITTWFVQPKAGPDIGAYTATIALYDNSGKLLTFKMQDMLASGGMAITGINIPVSEGTKVKAMMWKSLGTMEPLCESQTMIRRGNDWVDSCKSNVVAR